MGKDKAKGTPAVLWYRAENIRRERKNLKDKKAKQQKKGQRLFNWFFSNPNKLCEQNPPTVNLA